MSKKSKVVTVMLDDAAAMLDIHPRTVLRAITNDPNIYWAEGHNPELKLNKLVVAYEMDRATVDEVIAGLDVYLKPDKAREYVSKLEGRKVPIRTFRHRLYPKGARTARVVRYSREDLEAHQATLFDD